MLGIAQVRRSDGRIVENGTYDELVQKSSAFVELITLLKADDDSEAFDDDGS